MASPVKTNQRRHDWAAAGDNTMENLTLTSDNTEANVLILADRLSKVEKGANQNQWSEAIADATLVQLASVSIHGEKISGSAERAVAAWLNAAMPVTLGAQWFNVQYRDKSDIAKTLAPHKKDIFAAWKKAASTKWGRVRDYARELAEPTLRELVEAVEDEAKREEYVVFFDLQPEPETEGEGAGTGNSSRNRDLYERSVCEIGKLYRALTATDNDDIIKAHEKRAEIVAALEHITKALTALDAPTEDEDLVKFMKEVAKR